MRPTTGQRAVFLDRDGTLTHPYHYPSRPEHLRLYDGIAPGLQQLQASGFKLIVITNQAGLARGKFTLPDLLVLHEFLTAELAQLGVHLDGIYHCPHHSDGIIPALSHRCTCRKPAPGMLLQAADDLGLDLGHSWFIGDIFDDIEAGHRAGCRSILVDVGTETAPSKPLRTPDFVARNTAHALAIIAMHEGLGPAVDVAYRPARWNAAQAGQAPPNTGLDT